MERRVAITGAGVLTSLGQDVETVWDNLRAGRSGIRRITAFDASSQRTQIAGEVVDYDPSRHFDDREIDRLIRTVQFGVVSARAAVADAGLEKADGLHESAVVAGTGYGGIPGLEEAYQRYFSTPRKRTRPTTVPRCMPNSASNQISIDMGLKGPNFTVSTACSSGANAVAIAGRIVRHGHAPMALAVGLDCFLYEAIFDAWAALRVMSKKGNDDPTSQPRPFDRDRDGLVMGEGACTLVLEDLEAARARGATVYAELAGSGVNCDAHHITAPLLEGNVEAIRLGLDNGDVRPEEVGYVNAHGTATALNDVVETQAIREVFGEHADDLLVSSSKSMLGHTMGASGAIECLITALALRDQVAPPTRNLANPDDECDLDYVPGEARPFSAPAAISNSFAFGGSNCVLSLRRCED